MPKFIKALDVLGDNNNLDYINYRNLNQNHQELIRTDLWDLQMTKRPAAVYYPGDPIFKARLVGVEPSISDEISGLEVVVRGYTIKQKTSTNTSGTCTLKFVDREDQAITAFMLNWKESISDPDNKFSFRKEDTIADLQYKRFITSRIAIRQLRMETCQPSSTVIPETGEGEVEVSTNLSEMEMELDFEHGTRKLLNMM